MNEKIQNLKDASDETVLTASLQDPRLFSILFDRYYDSFIRKAEKILKTRDRAEDAVQETIVRIYIHAKKFTPQEGATFKSWGYKILINTSFSLYKKTSRDESAVLNFDDEDMERIPDVSPEFEKKLDMNRFLSAVSKIPVFLARVLRLTVLEGKTPAQIAEIEGASVGAIRTRIHRAKKEFKKVLHLEAV